MKELTEHLLPHAERMDEFWVQGAVDRLSGRAGTRDRLSYARKIWAAKRAEFGLSPLAPTLLTPPSANAKLNKAVDPSYGLTLQHHAVRLRPGLTVNACPWAGDCTRVCVLDTGHGAFEGVQVARKAKTGFLYDHPLAFSYLFGYDLAKAQMKDGPILFRPNVNSDVQWELLLPSLTDGRYLHFTQSYGYTKNPAVLQTNGWLGRAYRVAYSLSEKTDLEWSTRDLRTFLMRGGSIAAVTNRQRRRPVEQWATELGKVVDADKSDEWIFEEGVIGDLSAKGKARRLIGRSGFVREVY